MTWKTILKQIRRKPQISMAGGSKADDLREEELNTETSLDEMYDPMTEEELASATRDDILTEFEYFVKNLSKEQLIKLLIETKGMIKLKDNPFE